MSQRPWNRRAFLGAAALTVTGGCGSRRRPDDELRVFVYAGGHEKMMREVFVPVFERETGTPVSLYPGWWDGIPKLKAAPRATPPFDLMITDATQGYPAAREGLFAPIDLRNVPNHLRLAPSSLDNWIFRDRHGIPYPDSVMTLGYNRQRVGKPPEQWGDLLRPDLVGKIGLYQSYYMSLYTFACVLADREGRGGTAARWMANHLDELMRFARDNREAVKVWWPNSADMILALARGECAGGNMHSPEYLQALREKPELGAVVPSMDRAFVQVFWAIPAGCPNQPLAERAVNLLFSEEVQLGFARMGSATSILSVAEKVSAEDPLWKQLYPHTAEQFHDLRYYPYDLYEEHGNTLADEWDRTVLRKS